jgi:asparagine synthetase B (glutamine-hydrolysing)
MCGVVGVLGWEPVEQALVLEMRDRLIHRGPDAAGIWVVAGPRVPRPPAANRRGLRINVLTTIGESQ